MDNSINFRYPGSRPFQDTQFDRLLFFGRDKEKNALLDKILAQRLVVLFARSGLGKTSLINAGLMKTLRKISYLPFTIPLNTTDMETGEVIKPLPVIYSEIKKTVEEHKIDHTPSPEITLWQYFKTAQFWSEDDILMTPVLVLDQFEELFTLHHKKTREDFINQLADLIRDRLPENVRNSIKSMEKLGFNDSPPNVKIIISIKEDYIGRLEEMSYEIPHILKNRFRLLPLTREQAKEAIVKPAELDIAHIDIKTKSFNYETDAINEMLDFLGKKRAKRKKEESEDIEPFQLQLLCQHIEDKISKAKDKMVVRSSDLGGRKGMLKILQSFYDAQVTGFHNPWERYKVRRLFNSGLIMSGLRISQHEKAIQKKFKISKKILAELVRCRLMRAETRSTGVYYELSHDTLVEPILKSQKLKKKKFAYGVLSLVGIVVLIMALFLYPKITSYIYMKSGIASLSAGEYEKAEENFNKVIDMAPNNVEALFQLGNVYSQKNEYDKAVVCYQSVIKKAQNKTTAYLNLGNVYTRQGDYDNAINCYSTVIKLDPNNYNAFLYTADAYYRLKKYEDAIEYYRDAHKINPEDHRAYFQLGKVLFTKRDFDGAIDNYRKVIALDPNNYNAFLYTADAYYKLKKYKDAIEYNRDALKIRPADHRAYFQLGEVFYKKRDYAGAIDNYNESLKLNPQYAKAKTGIAAAYIGKGDKFYLKNDFDAAITSYQKAADFNSQTSVAYQRLGFCYNAKYEYDKACDNFKYAYELDPNNLTNKLNLAESYLLTNEFEKSVNLAEKIIEDGGMTDEEVLAMRITLASSFLLQGKRSKGREELQNFLVYYKQCDDKMTKRWTFKGLKIYIKVNIRITDYDKSLILSAIDILELPKKRSQKKILWLESAMKSYKDS